MRGRRGSVKPMGSPGFSPSFAAALSRLLQWGWAMRRRTDSRPTCTLSSRKEVGSDALLMKIKKFHMQKHLLLPRHALFSLGQFCSCPSVWTFGALGCVQSLI